MLLTRGRHRAKVGQVKFVCESLSLSSACRSPQPSPSQGWWATGGDEQVRPATTHKHARLHLPAPEPCLLQWHSGPEGSLGPLWGNSISIRAYYVTINTTVQCRVIRLTEELSFSASSHSEREGLRVGTGREGRVVSPGR